MGGGCCGYPHVPPLSRALAIHICDVIGCKCYGGALNLRDPELALLGLQQAMAESLRDRMLESASSLFYLLAHSLGH